MQEELSFGVWLRKQRRALDLTRRAFAKQVGCAEITLRHIEAGILKPSRELAGILLERVGVPETERPGWIAFARGLSGFPLSSAPAPNTPTTNLPAQLTTFIGREKEQSDVVRLLGKHRLVSLTGPGGVGKTRLSVEVGEQVLSDYAHGVWFVELAPIRDAVLVPRTTAIAIGLRDEPQRPVIDMLSDYLREKQLLIILDNCEHLLETCAQVADTLLKRCPNLKILATSREALGILGEAIYPVPSLQLPDLQQLLENIRDYESIRLFEERAQLAEINFSLSVENAYDVAKICSRLDGIPLAIELAAARIGTFSTKQIEERLQESFSLLSTGNRTALPRHRTLQATIDWSYDLLSSAEQTLFRRLSVFVDGWTLEAAESVCSDISLSSNAISDLLIQLISKSLVVPIEDRGKIRYRILETIRQYAHEKLIESGERHVLLNKHLEYFLNLAQTAERHLIRPEQIDWLPLLDADYENLRHALDWSLSRETAEVSLNLCSALWWFWIIRCYWLEGENWTTRALTNPAQNESMNEKIARARALWSLAHLEWQLGNRDRVLALAQESLALASEVSSKRDVAIARYHLAAWIAHNGEDDDQAFALMEQSFVEFQELDDPFWQAKCFFHLVIPLGRKGKRTYHDLNLTVVELSRKAGERLTLADALWMQAEWLLINNKLDEARKYAEESDRLYKVIGAENNSLKSSMLAEIAWLEGDYQTARSLFLEIQERFRLLGDKFASFLSSADLALLAVDEGDFDRAGVELAQSVVLAQEVGFKPSVAFRLIELSRLFYLQGNIEGFKQRFKESLSLRNYLADIHKPYILMNMLDTLYSQQPESLARILGVIGNSEMQSGFPLRPRGKRACSRAEMYARMALGDMAFDAAFAEGQKMSLDEALDLALKTVEEM